VFWQRFSSVVGPNGSGKSNVIDAMLFVFGKRAKQLRLNKVSLPVDRSRPSQSCDLYGITCPAGLAPERENTSRFYFVGDHSSF
jgi:AAA15 family ATPase/GTPase